MTRRNVNWTALLSEQAARRMTAPASAPKSPDELAAIRLAQRNARVNAVMGSGLSARRSI